MIVYNEYNRIKSKFYKHQKLKITDIYQSWLMASVSILVRLILFFVNNDFAKISFTFKIMKKTLFVNDKKF